MRWLLLLLLALPLRLAAQTIQPTVYFSQAVRDTLAANWDEKDPNQPERAYCAFIAKYTAKDGTIAYAVASVSRALEDSTKADQATPYTVVYSCPRTVGAGFVIGVHTHPPTTCANTCFFGGSDAYMCQPSDIDIRTLTRSLSPFDVLQCDRHALVPYFPLPRPKKAAIPLHVPEPKTVLKAPGKR